MMGRKGEQRVPYSEAQVTAWLAWLARGMQQHGQTVFQIEQLEPNWLTTQPERQFFMVATRLVWGMVAALSFLLVMGIALGVDTKLLDGVVEIVLAPGLTEMRDVAVNWLSTAIAYGLAGGLIGGLIDAWMFERHIGKPRRSSRSRLQRAGWGFVTSFLIYGILGGLIYGLIVGFDTKMSDQTPQWLMVGMLFGLVFGFFRTTRSSLREPDSAIRPVETLQWSWASAGRIGFYGLLFGLVSGVLYGLIFGRGIDLAFVPFFGLIFAVLDGILLALVGGFRPGVREMKTTPNQGIRLSLNYAIRSGILSGAIFSILLTLITRDVGIGLGYGFLAGIIFSMYFGGLEVIEHGILRVILAARKHAPWNYVRFLDYAAVELNFLQKVGGGYVFIHRYLLEHFAENIPVEPRRSGDESQARISSS